MGRMSAWWSSLGFGKAVAPVDDYADMGTAFGLDASLDTVPSAYAPPVPPVPETHAGPSAGERAGMTRR